MEVMVTTGAIIRTKLQSNRPPTNTKLSTGRNPFLSSKQQCRSTEGKSHAMLYVSPNAYRLDRIINFAECNISKM